MLKCVNDIIYLQFVFMHKHVVTIEIHEHKENILAIV